MNALPLRDDPAPIDVLTALAERHGLRRVLFAALRLAVRPRVTGPRRFPGTLNDHLRRDIGLPDLPPPLPSERPLPPF
jgi:hypothetical protein